MTTVGGNYISDGQLMAWLASQQDRIYGDLRESMDLSEKRSDFQGALTNIKTKLSEANGQKDFGEVDAMLQELMSEYGNDPQFTAACEQLQGMADTIHANHQRASTYQAPVTPTQSQPYVSGPSRSGSPQPYHTHAPVNPPVTHYSSEKLKEWENLIGGQIDNLGRNDQLTMIHIQELKATLDQSSQLASTFISSSDKTSSAIINNIA